MSDTRPSVAVLGASADRRKFGNKSVRAHAHAGWRVVPVNPQAGGGQIEGHDAVATLAEAGAVDRVTVYLPPYISATLIDEMAATGAAEVYFNPGSADTRVLQLAREKGLPALDACSIVELGLSPAQFGDV